VEPDAYVLQLLLQRPPQGKSLLHEVPYPAVDKSRPSSQPFIFVERSSFSLNADVDSAVTQRGLATAFFQSQFSLGTQFSQMGAQSNEPQFL
jgi:hypothetical protein